MEKDPIPQATSPLATWLSYLEHLHSKTIDLGLARVSEVAGQMDIVKPAPFVFTVAGTNGKGTTCRTLETILMAAGYGGSTALRIWCATPNACAFRGLNCRRRRIQLRLLKSKRRGVTSR
nr:hypothetical protein GCM10025699_38890 [Microbacterium flavescens]